MSASPNRVSEGRKSWGQRIKAWLCGPSRRTEAKLTFKPRVESLEERDVPASPVNPLQLYGISSALANYMASSYAQYSHQAPLLTPHAVSPQLQQQTLAHMRSNANNLAYYLDGGYSSDLMTLYGYGRYNNLTATSGTAQQIYNNGPLAIQSGQAAYNSALNFFTDNFGRGGSTAVNALGIAQSVGLQQYDPGFYNALAQAQAVGAFGGGSATGFGVSLFGPPIGTNPQDRFTYGGPLPTGSSPFGPPVGYNPLLGSPFGH
jgi:hypothetical protein